MFHTGRMPTNLSVALTKDVWTELRCQSWYQKRGLSMVVTRRLERPWRSVSGSDRPLRYLKDQPGRKVRSMNAFTNAGGPAHQVGKNQAMCEAPSIASWACRRLGSSSCCPEKPWRRLGSK